MGSLAPVDTFITPKVQGTSHKRDQKDFQSHTSRKSAVRLCLLEMPWLLDP